MLKKTLLSLSCALAMSASAVSAFAATKFYLVVPVPSRAQAQEPVESITVTLAGAALPKATVSKAYSESLRPYLSVTGDSAFDAAAARWSVAQGTLPAGLTLNETTGAVAGTPTAKTSSPASFTVLAAYKGKDGQAVYTIEVGGNVLHVRHIAAGQQHTCAVTDVGAVKCWGANANGQLGNGSTAAQLTPVQVVGLESGVVAVDAGIGHTCALTSAGAVMCWGQNASGQLGDGTSTSRNTPVQAIDMQSGVSQITAGGPSSCAVRVGGAVKCWGATTTGASVITTPTPALIEGLEAAVEAVVGVNFSCARTTGGAVKCWGSNLQGQLGDGTGAHSTTPVQVVGLGSNVASLAAGNQHACARTNGGAVWCWGANNSGQLGDGTTVNQVSPVPVIGLGSGVAALTAGAGHTCTISTTGVVNCWGRNTFGQLGNGSTSDSPTPVTVEGLVAQKLDASTGHTCAITTEGEAKCWGNNANGQFGNNSTASSSIPVEVQGN